ncbi:uncharacterized protein LOC106659882 [Trichogramma pretiosum]|uniref:uncharacterized protein LOC106659882 n=1 Tax=Trichogramma pretiosum TaxID=7493 RepID=UPI0006C9A11F|nr:uncharacterized protein LOC106659882 [Trichogramma pretiosum]XP_014238119.1 uncharacterized protein LOC106659882 [Trichogramma pretiosum]XP_014238127.1 uncharacterized protein LOC106659882 [Trichogramma pretiosum]XP_014238137.1 uncharacterized protein LOC106659882 [Trichogramma pretiosum]
MQSFEANEFMQECDMKSTSKQAEKILYILYSFCAIASIISMVSLIVPWQHWAFTLAVSSPSVENCECILNGVATFNTFMGGNVRACHFGAYGLLPCIVFSTIMASYHGYRSCISRTLSPPRTVTLQRIYRGSKTNLDDQIFNVAPKQRYLFGHWMSMSIATLFLCVLAFCHTVVITDGYFKTCSQYRNNLGKLLHSTGEEMKVIRNRLSCGAIFDYMDYIQPDANNWRRAESINTGLALQLSITTSSINFILLIIICSINFYMKWKKF